MTTFFFLSCRTKIFDDFINGKEYNVKNYHYSVTQPADVGNKPMVKPLQGYINLTVEPNDDEFLFHWFIKPYMVHDGKIVFYSSNQSAAVRKVQFKQGFCVYYNQDFND